MKLTQRRIEDLECPAGRRTCWSSTTSRPASACASRRAAAKSYLAQYPCRREAPRPARLMLGDLAGGRAGGRAGDPRRRRERPRPGRRTEEAAQRRKRKAAHEPDARRVDRAMGGAAPRRQARALRRGGRPRPPLCLRQAPEGRPPPISTAPPSFASSTPRQGRKGGHGEPHGRLWPRLLPLGGQARLARGQPVRKTFRLPRRQARARADGRGACARSGRRRPAPAPSTRSSEC